MMSKKALIVVGVSILLLAAAFIFIVATRPSSPNIHVKNADTNSVKVIARWRDNTKDMGEVIPGEVVEFLVDDEATISLEIKRANGSAVSTGEIRLPSNVSTYVEITRNGVAVKSDVGN